MIERGDYVVPYFNNRYRFDKPPLTYWFQVASYRILGENAFAARLPSALAAALTALVIFAWGRRLRLARAGFWAAIIFTLCLQVFIHAKAAVADMWLVFFMTLAHWAGYELWRDRFGGSWRSAVVRPEGLRLWWWLFYFSLACAFLAKGPIGWMPLGTVGVVQFLLPTAPFARRFLFVRGTVLMLVLVALWGVPALLRTHGEFLQIGLGQHVVGRSFGTMQGHGGNSIAAALLSLPFYFFTVFLSFAPWSCGLPWLTRRLWKKRDALDLYLIAGCVVIFVIFTIVKTKLPHYILPAFPLLALLLARHWLDAGVTERALRRWSLATVAVMLAVALVGFPLLAPIFPSDALFKKAEPYLQPEMDFAAYDFDAPSLVWNFRSRVRGFLYYNKEDGRDVTTLQPDQVPQFLERAGPHFVVVPTPGRGSALPDAAKRLSEVLDPRFRYCQGPLGRPDLDNEKHMITFLHGRLTSALPTQAVIDVNGVGYELFIPLSSYDKLPAPGEVVHILTHLHVREDAQILYGFMSGAERDLFRLLVNHVSGIGPKLALAVLSGMSVSYFKSAVVNSDVASLSKISGLGKKTAERIVLELKDKLGVAAAWEVASGAQAPTPDEEQANEAVLALIALGYKQVDAHKAVREIQQGGKEPKSAEDLVRLTLQRLASGR